MMESLFNVFSPALVNALGWTILHSLWQGALVALVLVATLRLALRRSAQWRYTVAVSAFGLLFVSVVGTFGWLYHHPPTVATAAEAAYPMRLSATPAASEGATVSQIDWTTRFSQQAGRLAAKTERYLPWMVGAWWVGILFLMFRWAGGLAYTQWLRRSCTPLSGAWQQRLGELSDRMGMPRTVALAESALLQVPVVVGHFKPLILLPVGAVTGLPPAQIEAILAHELAHIRRHDYLINLIQSVVELLLFYHPAVWWVSGQIRAEREHCCDDLAVLACGDRLSLAQALTELAAHTANTAPRLAVALSGGTPLLDRIRRLVQPGATVKQRVSHSLTGGLATLLLLTALFINTIHVRAARVERAVMSIFHLPQLTPPALPLFRNVALSAEASDGTCTDASSFALLVAPGDTSDPTIAERQVAIDSGRTIKILQRQGQLLVVTDGDTLSKVWEKDESDVQTLSFQLPPAAPSLSAPPRPSAPAPPSDVAVAVSPDSGAIAVVVRPDPCVPTVITVPGGSQVWSGLSAVPCDSLNPTASVRFAAPIRAIQRRAAEMESEARRLAESFQHSYQREWQEHIREQAEEMQVHAEALRQAYGEAQRDLSEADREQQEEARREQFEEAMRDQKAAAQRVRFEIERQADALRKQHESVWQETQRHFARRRGASLRNAVAEQLLSDGLIKSTNDLRFRISDQSLEINGKKQPQRVYDKYRQLYEASAVRPLKRRFTFFFERYP